MRAFIVRPFGAKEGIDFDAVERDLIQPALQQLQKFGYSIVGSTTADISRQGNIREDMFRLLVIADLVLADVSIHNANVFYELGIRHSLRPTHTFLLRARTDDPYPFDLQTDRYFLYDAKSPGDKIAALTQALNSTLASLAPNQPDSPVFNLLPDLKAHGRGELVNLPSDFQDDVQRASVNDWRGDLRLFAYEVSSFEWDQEALRAIGDAQFRLRGFKGARVTFENLLKEAPDDIHANLRLATIYQRLSAVDINIHTEDLLSLSDQAIRRVLAREPAPATLAEAYALLGSNDKARWIAEYSAAQCADRSTCALQSGYFSRMLEWYLKAANVDLNAHYPEVNALTLLAIQRGLAKKVPDVWNNQFDDDMQAAAALTARNTLINSLVGTLRLALEMDEIMGRREGGAPDPWAKASRADLMLVTLDGKAQRVATAFRDALTGANRFTLEATRRSLAMFKDLGLFEDNANAALKVVDEISANLPPERVPPARVILFTGHRVDDVNRPREAARFPRTASAEQKARALIEEAIRHEQSLGGDIIGIAGAASGGDILFHEVCKALGIETHGYLGLPVERFQVESVQDGGASWVERYRAIVSAREPRVLQQERALPRWLADKPNYEVWQRSNLWMMFCALAMGARDLTLIALFNPEREADGPGGTQHLLSEASTWGFKPVTLDARVLLAE